MIVIVQSIGLSPVGAPAMLSTVGLILNCWPSL
jgi:hypothetical protein